MDAALPPRLLLCISPPDLLHGRLGFEGDIRAEPVVDEAEDMASGVLDE